MKKFLCALLALCFMFSLAACREAVAPDGSQTENPGQTDDLPSYEGETIALSAQMFENARVDLDGVENIGIIMEEGPTVTGETTERSYLVSFKEDGSFEKITFVFTTTQSFSDGTYKVTQEQIEGSPLKVYVTDSFIYLAYGYDYFLSIDSQNPSYNQTYYRRDRNFVIDRTDGMLYSMDEVDEFVVVSGNIIRDGEYTYSTFYSLEIEDGALKITDLLPNKNIPALDAAEDKFGNIYVQTEGYEGKTNGVVYGTNYFYTGDDGYVYETEKDIAASYRLETTFLLRRYGQDGEPQQNWTADTIIRMQEPLETSAETYVMLLGNKVFVFMPDSNGVDNFWYGERPDTNTVKSSAYLWYMDGAVPVAPGMIAAYATYGTGGSEQIWYYDMSEMYIDTRVETTNQGYICDRGLLYTEGEKAYVRTEDVYGTNIRILEQTTDKNGKTIVAANPYQKITSTADVIMVQPLN